MFFFVVYDHLLKILKEKKTTISISGLKKSFSHGLRDCGMISIQLLLCLVFCKFNLNSQTVDMKLELSDDCVLLEDVFFYRLHTFFSGFVGGWLVNSQIRIQSYYSSLGHGSIIVQSLVVFCVWPNGVRR